MEEISTNSKLNFLSGGGEMGERIRNFDWTKTPLGNPETWESSLKTCVRIMLTSPQPMFVWWGDELINIYNDAYSVVLGKKHPAMLGISGQIAWKEIWDEISIRVKTVFEKNEGTFDDSLLLIMNRNGYDEETYFKFSYNPIPGIKKTTEGLFCVCTEETQRIIHERALDTLRKLGAINFTERSLDIIYRNVADALASNYKDFPFALVYKITGEANTVTVAASTGIDKSQHVFPDKIDVTKPTAITKDFCKAFRENKMVVSDIKAEGITLPTGAWETAPQQFIYLPVSGAGSKHPYCIISAALNPYRPFDDTYRQFCQLIGDRVSIEINKMLAVEIERKKAEALAEIDRAKIVFFSNISHEFRTPLTLMLSPLEEILNQKQNNFNKSEKQNIEIAQRNGMRLLKLVNTLLDFSNIEKGKHQAIFSLVDIVALTKNLAANFRSVIEKAGMKMIVKADTIIQPVYVDKQMWEKIVFNLLSNAFKYTLEGKITVELAAEKDFAVLKVKDTGVGIPENELPKMFERFHRVQNVAGRTYEGTGIGLSLVKELVLLHHGEISVDSVLNKGSVFTVKIPFGKEHVNGHQILKRENDADEVTSDIYMAEIETLPEREESDALKTATVKEKNNLSTVLVVDDNADMREHISSLLSNNFNVITANNGVDALHRIKETTIDLVLSDIMMPVMDGIGLLKEIKSNKATANISVIFLTARAGEESRVEGWESGADDYLVKPFSSKELRSRVKAQIKMVKLRQSLEGNMRNLFLKAPALICVFRGPQHVIELANEMYLQTIGNRDVLGKPAIEALPEAEGQGYLELLDNVYSTGEPFIGTEMPAQLDNGNGKLEEFYFNFVYQPVHSSEGEIDGIFLHGVDVTQQVLARKEIEESEKRFQLLVRNATVAIIVLTGAEMKVEIVNEAYGRLINLNVADLLGKPLFSLVPEAEKYYLPILEKVRQTGEPVYLYDSPYAVTVNGKHIEGFLHVVYQPYRNTDGKIIGVMAILQDVTESVVARKKIEQSEKKFEAAILAVEGIIWTNNANGEMMGEQPGWAKLTGQTFEEYQGYGWAKAVHPDDAQPTVEAWNKAVASKSTFDFEHRVNTRQDGWKLFSIKAVPVFDEKGSIQQWVGVHTDITEQREAVQKIKESEERFHNLIYSSPSAIGILEGKDLIIKIGNAPIIEIWGKGKEIIGRKYFEALPELAEQGYKEVFEQVYKTGIPFTAIETPVSILQNGVTTLKYYNFILYPQRNINNEVNGIGIIATEVTSQAIFNNKIKESEERFRSLAQTLPQLVWITDAQGNLEFASIRWKEYTGIEPGGEKEWKAIVHPDDYDNINAAWEHSLTTGNIYIFEVRLKNKDGQYKWHGVKGEPVVDKENKIVKWVGAFTDIHEQKLKEEKKDEFISIASHEMKTPLTTAKAYLQMLELSLDDNNKDVTLYAKKASQSVNKLNELISELLDVSKIRLGKLNYTITSFDFNDMVDSTVENIQLISPTHIIVKTGKVYDKVTGDEDRLRQVIINLISNAIKYSPGSEKIFITVEQQNDMIKVSVRDTGIGIVKQSLDKIFEKYHRIEEHAAHFQGLGIGLFLSYEIIQRHHGKLWAESEQGKGSTFYFTLPLSYNELAQ